MVTRRFTNEAVDHHKNESNVGSATWVVEIAN